MQQLGKLVIALRKIKFRYIDSHTFNQKEKIRNGMEYIKDITRLVNIDEFKEMTMISMTKN